MDLDRQIIRESIEENQRNYSETIKAECTVKIRLFGNYFKRIRRLTRNSGRGIDSDHYESETVSVGYSGRGNGCLRVVDFEENVRRHDDL